MDHFRFQDEDDKFSIDDVAPKPRATSTPAKKADDNLDWLEMATGGRTPDKPAVKADITDKTPEKVAAKEPEPSKPSTAPPKSNKAADWLGLKDDDDEEEYDYLKASSFSAPARQGQPTVSGLHYS